MCNIFFLIVAQMGSFQNKIHPDSIEDLLKLKKVKFSIIMTNSNYIILSL